MTNPHTACRRLIAAVLLCAHVCTGTVMIPAAGALLAAMDGSHALLVVRSALGYELVLHHAEGIPTPGVMDHGTAAARMLVSVCKSCPEGDHKLESALLAGADSFKEDPRMGSPALGESVWLPGVPAADVHAALQALPLGGCLAAGPSDTTMRTWPPKVQATVRPLV